MAPLPMGTNQQPGGRLITLDLCLHRGGKDSPSLEYICFLNVELPSLNIILQPAVPSVYLWNALSIIMVFCLALLLIQEPISQLRKYSMGLMLMESTGLNTRIPSPRSRWPNWELEGLIEDSVLVPVGRQYPKTKWFCFTGYSICLESATVTGCSLPHGQNTWIWASRGRCGSGSSHS